MKIWLAFACFLIASCGHRSPPGAVLYSSQPPRPQYSTQQRGYLTEADIASLVQRGDAEYANGNFNAAKNYYYEVLLAVPNPNVYVLVSYGSSLTNLGLYENAIEIFNMALEKDPYNETARKNIAICRYFIGQEAESQRQFEQDQQRIKRENLQNLAGMATMGKMTQNNMDSVFTILNLLSDGAQKDNILNEQNMALILASLGEMAQKNKDNKKLISTLNNLNKVANEYKRVQSAENEQNLIAVLNSLNEMAQEYQSKQR